MVTCQECGAESQDGRGWRAYLAGVDGEDDIEVGVYCPICADREFGVASSAMPSRLDSVNVAYSRGTVRLPWTSRDALLGEIEHLEEGRVVCDVFRAVGASRPVELPPASVAFLIHAINLWSHRVGVDELPEGVWELRNALIDDEHDAGRGP